MKSFKNYLSEDLDNSGKYHWDESNIPDYGSDAVGGSGLWEEEQFNGIDDYDDPTIHHENAPTTKAEVTDDEGNSAAYYGFIGHKKINDRLRGKLQLFKDPDHDEHVKNLDSFINKHEVIKNTHVWRGITNKAAKKLGLGNGKNHILTDRGFMSTSMDPEVARAFSDGIEKSDSLKSDHLIHIVVPKGSKGVYMNHHIEDHPEEHEVLLPRNSRLKYSHSTEDKDGLIKVHHYEYLPPIGKTGA
jgi:hypothetical protein